MPYLLTYLFWSPAFGFSLSPLVPVFPPSAISAREIGGFVPFCASLLARMTQTVKNKEPRVFLKRGEGISRFDKGGLAQLRASALELGTAAHNGSVATHESAPARLAAASRPAAHHSRASTPAQQHRRPERTDQQQGFHVLEESIRRQTDGCWPSAEAAPDPLGGGASAPRQAANAEAWADADAGHAGSVAGWCLGSTGQAPGDDDGAGGGADAWKRAFGATALISAAPTLILPLIPASAAQGGAVQKVLVSFAVGGLLGDGACAVLFLFCFLDCFCPVTVLRARLGEGGFASSMDGRW